VKPPSKMDQGLRFNRSQNVIIRVLPVRILELIENIEKRVKKGELSLEITYNNVMIFGGYKEKWMVNFASILKGIEMCAHL
jgi:hypothetical protein